MSARPFVRQLTVFFGVAVALAAIPSFAAGFEIRGTAIHPARIPYANVSLLFYRGRALTEQEIQKGLARNQAEYGEAAQVELHRSAQDPNVFALVSESGMPHAELEEFFLPPGLEVLGGTRHKIESKDGAVVRHNSKHLAALRGPQVEDEYFDLVFEP